MPSLDLKSNRWFKEWNKMIILVNYGHNQTVRLREKHGQNQTTGFRERQSKFS